MTFAIWVAGASYVIGAALAPVFVQARYPVVLHCAREEPVAAALVGGSDILSFITRLNTPSCGWSEVDWARWLRWSPVKNVGS